MTATTSTATVLTTLHSAGLALALTPDQGLGVAPKTEPTNPKTADRHLNLHRCFSLEKVR